MKRNRIFYLGYFECPNSQLERLAWQSGITKMQYISRSLVKAGKKVCIISPSMTQKDSGYYPGEDVKITHGVNCHFFPTFGVSNDFLKKIRSLYSYLCIVFFVLLHVKRNEEVLVYHIPTLMLPVLIAKKLKRFKLILEVEEIYQEVRPRTKFVSRLEYITFSNADKFIFSTYLLNDRINLRHRPFIVVHGTYDVQFSCEINNKSCDKINCVYAGILEASKGCGFVIDAARYLPEKYRIFIAGYGTPKQIQVVKERIKDLPQPHCEVFFEGLLTGSAYENLLNQCDIGLCLQDPNASYTQTSFPSKILVYLAHGLRVLSIRIPAIEQSEIGDLLYYCDEVKPETIAKRLRAISLDEEFYGAERLKQLDFSFCHSLQNFIE